MGVTHTPSTTLMQLVIAAANTWGLILLVGGLPRICT